MAYIFVSSRGGAGDTSKGDQAYEESILSADITGDVTKTLNLNQRNGNICHPLVYLSQKYKINSSYLILLG